MQEERSWRDAYAGLADKPGKKGAPKPVKLTRPQVAVKHAAWALLWAVQLALFAVLALWLLELFTS